MGRTLEQVGESIARDRKNRERLMKASPYMTVGDAETVDRIPLIQPDLPDMADLVADLDGAFKSGRITNFGPLVEQFE